jgi:hypothetical protein
VDIEEIKRISEQNAHKPKEAARREAKARKKHEAAMEVSVQAALARVVTDIKEKVLARAKKGYRALGLGNTHALHKKYCVPGSITEKSTPFERPTWAEIEKRLQKEGFKVSTTCYGHWDETNGWLEW